MNLPLHKTWLVRGVLSCLAGVTLLCVAEWRSPESDTDARIRFYRRRIGGPGTYPAYARLGAAYLQKAAESGDARYYQEAERHLLESLRFQHNHEALRLLAAVYATQHRFQAALPYARQAVESMPEDPETQGILFDVYLGLRNRAQAAQILGSMEQRPSFASWARRAALGEFDGDAAGAVQAVERACQIAETQRLPPPIRAWCHMRAGVLRARNCDPNRARQAYGRALSILPGYAPASRHLAELRAKQALPRAVAISPFANPDCLP